MKTICAYCKRHIKGNRHDERVSHGICAICQPKVLAGQEFIRQGQDLPVIWVEKEADNAR